MKQFVRDYLTFNKRERNGLFVLIAIISLMLVYLNTSHLFVKPDVVDFTEFEDEVKQFNSAVLKSTDSLKESRGNDVTNTPERFVFNPNNLSDEKWNRLGLSSKQIKTINNFQKKGGVFRKKEDLKKIYGLSQNEYLSLADYIHIPIKKSKTSSVNLVIEKRDFAAIDINSADSTLLVSISGIGPFYAKQIIKYRTLLGGFVAKNQLLELWKFDSLKLVDVQNDILIDQLKVNKININVCTPKELKHPYLNWNIANAVCNYRNKHGRYRAIGDIKKTDLIDDETFKKIKPYLTVE